MTLYDRTIGRVTGWFDRCTEWLADGLPGASCAGRWSTSWPRWRSRSATFVGSFFMMPLLGTEFVPKADFSETADQLLHAGRLVARGDRGASAAGRRGAARDARGALHASPPSTAARRPGKIYARDLRAPGRPQGPQAQRRRRCRRRCASGWRASPASPSRNVGLHRPRRRQEPAVLAAGPRPGRARAAVARDHRQAARRSPAWSTSTPRSSPTSRRSRSRSGATPRPTSASTSTRSPARCARWSPAQTVGNWRAPDGENYDVNVRLAPASRNAHRRPAAPAAQRRRRADGSAAHRCGCRRWPRCTPSTGPNQINRRDLNREINIDANALGRSAGEVSADIRKVLDEHRLAARLPLRVRRLDQEHDRVVRLRGRRAGAGGGLHLHDPGQPVHAASCSRWR